MTSMTRSSHCRYRLHRARSSPPPEPLSPSYEPAPPAEASSSPVFDALATERTQVSTHLWEPLSTEQSEVGMEGDEVEELLVTRVDERGSDEGQRDGVGPSKKRKFEENRRSLEGELFGSTSTTRRTTPINLLDLPSKALDLILSSPILTIVDHLALAGVNRTLRSLYYSPPVAASHAQFEGLKLPTSELWRALNLFRPFVGSNNAGQAEKTEGSGEEVGPETLVEGLVSRIWSNAESARAKAGEMVVLQEVEKEGALRLKRKGGWEMERLPGVKYWRLVRSKEWEEAIGRCSKETIAQASAVRAYKVPKATLVKEFGQAEEYKEPRVLALALRLHGGVWGHQEWVTQKNEVNAKAKEARQKGKSGKGRRRRG